MMRLGYFLRRAVKGMRQAVFVNVVAVLTIAIALFVVAVFSGVVGQVRGLLDAWSSDLVVAVYLEDELAAEARVRIRAAIEEAAGHDARIMEVSKEEAMERLRASLADDADILQGLENNPLPESIEIAGGVSRLGRERLEEFAAAIESMEGVDEVDFGRDWVGRLEGLVSLLAIAGLFLGGLILLAAMVTVSNTIKLAVFARKDEIEIMKLCGATDSFVRAPFLIEGLLQGLMGSIIAGVAATFLWFVLLPRVEAGLAEAFAMQISIAAPGYVLPLLVVGGAALGLGGAALSLGRFLRV